MNGIKDVYRTCIPRLNVARECGVIRGDVLESLVVVGLEQMLDDAVFDSTARAEM
jgi:hypothetical protein